MPKLMLFLPITEECALQQLSTIIYIICYCNKTNEKLTFFEYQLYNRIQVHFAY